MGLLDKLTTGGSNLTKFDGTTPDTMPGSLKTSVLHDEYSINGSPRLLSKPKPSDLDWNGKTPTLIGKFPYLDNLPE